MSTPSIGIEARCPTPENSSRGDDAGQTPCKSVERVFTVDFPSSRENFKLHCSVNRAWLWSCEQTKTRKHHDRIVF